MKKFAGFLKTHHIIMISLSSLLIGLGSFILLVKNEISSYKHVSKIQKMNEERLAHASDYHNKFSEMIKKRALNTEFSGAEKDEIILNLMGSCFYIFTNDIKDARLVAAPLCTTRATNIFTKMRDFDSEVKRQEILQELDKLRTDINNFFQEQNYPF